MTTGQNKIISEKQRQV